MKVNKSHFTFNTITSLYKKNEITHVTKFDFYVFTSLKYFSNLYYKL